MADDLPDAWADTDERGPYLPTGGDGEAYRDETGHLLVHTGEEGEYIECDEPVEVRL